MQVTGTSALVKALREEAFNLGFAPVGIATVPGGERLQMRTAALQRWLAMGHHGSMDWMADARRGAIERLLPGVRSLVAVGMNYYIKAPRHRDSLKVARYGWGRDYHRVMDRRLRCLGRWVEAQAPGIRWRACVDTAPLMDKAWAEEAGIGWIGKNSNLINQRHGSWLLIGHLLTSLHLPADPQALSLCGRCTRCIDACPTGAITEPFVVNARRCIAYHTIENRDPVLPEAIVASLDGWVAGCDICQEVCPWNQPPPFSSTDSDLQPRPWVLNLRPGSALGWSDDEWHIRLRASALRRIRPWMWRRNIRAATGSTSDPDSTNP